MPVPSLPELSVEIGFGDTWETVSPSWTDITSYTRGLEIRRGRTFALDQFGPSTATILLDNTDRRFDPDYNSGAYYPDVKVLTPIRIRGAKPGGTLRLLYRGFVRAWPQQWTETGRIATSKIDCVDGMMFLSQAHLTGTSITGALSGTMIGDVLDDVGWPNVRDVDAGRSALQTIVVKREPALSVIQRIARSENTWFYFNREGQARFPSRHYRPTSERTPHVGFTDKGTPGGSAANWLYYRRFEQPFDDAQIWNRVLTQRAGKTRVTGIGNQLSIDRYGKRVLSLFNLLAVNQQQEEAAGGWALRVFKEPSKRARAQLRLNGQTGAAVDDAMTLDVDKMVEVQRDYGTGQAVDANFYVEGITHRVGLDWWDVEVELSPEEMWRCWFLGTQEYSELGETTWLGY
jgi:hypothetical protein